MKNPHVLGLNGYGLTIPDLEVGQRFYETFGLQSEQKGDAVILRSPGRSNDEIVTIKGREKKLHHVSFAVAPDSLDAFAEHLAQRRIAVIDKAPDGAARAGLWFQDPWGTWINLAPGALAPIEPIDAPASNIHGRAPRVDVNLWQELEQQRNRGPQRLGHILLFTADWEKAEAFYADALGLRTTDRAKGKVAFMAAGEGTIDHHCFGLINGTHRGFQHSSFQVPSIDHIGYGAWRMRTAGHKESFGPGRHAVASNLFHYVRDPWGSWVEYYADMDKITDAWECRDWGALPYTWGPEWSPEFWGGEMNANLEPR